METPARLWRLTSLSGLCVSPGFGYGRVVSPAADSVPDETCVLVAENLDPAQVPLVFNCAAVILATGGPTSHAALTLRELGIPAMVDVTGATSAMADGDRVYVDTEYGRIFRAEVLDSCLFCEPMQTPEAFGTERLRVVADAFPVVRDHLLVVPRRHVEDPDDLEDADWAELGQIVRTYRRDSATRDVNVALNAGPAAGQSVPHLHWHLLPRISGDDPDPRGGVRRMVASPFRPYPPPG